MLSPIGCRAPLYTSVARTDLIPPVPTAPCAKQLIVKWQLQLVYYSVQPPNSLPAPEIAMDAWICTLKLKVSPKHTTTERTAAIHVFDHSPQPSLYRSAASPHTFSMGHSRQLTPSRVT